MAEQFVFKVVAVIIDMPRDRYRQHHGFDGGLYCHFIFPRYSGDV
jgi:hypothetical protein